MRRSFFIIVALLSLTPPIAAQPVRPAISAGQRMLVTALDLGLMRQPATFEHVADGWLIATADTSLRIPLDLIQRIAVSAGRRSHPWRGAAIGFLGGAALGFGVWYAADLGCYPEAATIGCATVFGAFGGGVVGALVGTVVGGLVVRTDRWEPITLDALRVTVEPLGGGAVLRLTVGF